MLPLRLFMKSKFWLVFAALLVTPVLYYGTASATVFGGKWPRSGTYLYLYYYYGGYHRYLGNVYQGGANWTNTPTKVYVQNWPGVPYALEISAYDTYDSTTDALAWTVNSPCWTCTYSSSVIHLNQRTMDPLSDFMRTKVSTHELGHAIGLAHPPSTLTATSIMKQGYLNYNTPQSYDIRDVNNLYP